MKKTQYEKKIEREYIKFKVAKCWAYFQMKISFGKKRALKRRKYEIFEKQHFLDRDSNEIPDPFYFFPTDIVLYDLIRKSDLNIVKKGLIKLFKQCFTHKYLALGRANRDIDKLINELDRTVNSGYSWYNVGIFDFANKKHLDEYIDHYEIYFHNFSSSYAAIEIQINLSEKYRKEMALFIKSNYKKTKMSVHKYWMKNKSKSGAKIGYAVSGGTLSERAKCQIIYDLNP